jgi:hypothetical protein
MRLLSLFAISMVALCCFAQVRVASQAEKHADVTAQYDSTLNYLNPRTQSVYAYIGQDLYVLPTTDEYYYGFTQRSTMSTILRTKASELSGKMMHVDSVFEIDGTIGKDYVLVLTRTDDGARWFFQYPAFESSFPFLCMGYKKHYDDLHGKFDFYVRHGIRYWNKVDFETGNRLEWEPMTVWKFSESVYDPKHGFAGLYKNSDGQTIAIYNEEDIVPTLLFEAYVSNYGADMCKQALKGLIAKDMPDMLLEIAWGKPDKIDYDTYGQYWIYESNIVRLEGGKVVSWSSY